MKIYFKIDIQKENEKKQIINSLVSLINQNKDEKERDHTFVTNC